MSAVQSLCKRVFDFSVSLLALVALSPFFLLLSIIVKIDSKGPVLFRQRRLGKDATEFEILKFRSMQVDCPDMRNEDGSSVVSAHDPRVTRFGRLLRATSLDELPQLWNVLMGDMSLVGPRPDQADQLRFYSADEKKKLLVRPGLTGLAQLSGRNAISWSERKKLDGIYVERQSFLLDMGLLLKTIPYVISRHGVVSDSDKVANG